MPRIAQFVLQWSEEHACYQLYDREEIMLTVPPVSSWLAWLNTHTSCSFHGQHGHFSLLKEARKHSPEGYWYAYQRQGKQTLKRYAGKSAELTAERLEEIGELFQQAARPSPPLLLSKLCVPGVSPLLVKRERLLALLDAACQRPLTLVIAPAGSGKTTLLAQWIAEQNAHEHSPLINWVSLDPQDNDPVRFWRYILTACAVLQPAQGRERLLQLAMLSAFPPEAAFLDMVLTDFLNDLARSQQRSILILDNYQVITTAAIHQTLAFFLEHLPASLQLVILTRSLPAFPLAQLRVQDRLSELGVDALRFSQKETLAFFQQAFPSFSFYDEVQQINTCLQGWAAGLRLFALALQPLPTQTLLKRSLAEFASQHRPLQDYILEEIFRLLPDSQQHFLLSTCLLERLTPALCNAVTGGQDSALILRTMEQAGLFLERLDGPEQGYRYQTFFAEALRVEARLRLPEETRHELLLRASRWYEQQNQQAEAIELLLQACELTQAAALINSYLQERGFADTQEFLTLQRWLEPLPEALLAHYPLLCLHAAQVRSLQCAPNQPAAEALSQMERLLLLAEDGWRAEHMTTRLGEVYAFRAYIAIVQGLQKQSVDYARQARQWLPPEAQHWRGVCLHLLSAYELRYGDVSLAQTFLVEALSLWRILHHKHAERNCLLLLAIVSFELGKLSLSATYYRRVAQEAREVGDREDLVLALLGLARLAYEWNDLSTALRSAQEARDISTAIESHEVLVHAELLLIRMQSLSGEQALAEQCLAALRIQCSASPELAFEVQLHQLSLWLAANDFTTVQHYLDTLSVPEGIFHGRLGEQKTLLQAQVALSLKRHAQAEAALDALRNAAQQTGRARFLLRLHLLLARTALAEGRIQEADCLLETILVQAHTEGFLRTFLDEGKEARELLSTLCPSIKDSTLKTFLHVLLQAFETTTRATGTLLPGPDPLTHQEQRVLALLVAERSYPDMARELTVSINTIKTQVSSIYRKLNVHSRGEARSIARQYQLLSPQHVSHS